MQLLQIEGVNSGGDWVNDWFEAADPTWQGGEGFLVAPSILPATYSGTLRMLREYVAASGSHPSAATVNGRLVVYVYSGRTLPKADWIKLRADLESAGTPVYLIGELSTEASQHQNRVTSASISYADVFDATWLFDDQDQVIWRPYMSAIGPIGKPFAGGLMAGYNRETTNGGYVDAKATATLRRAWQFNLTSELNWSNMLTWNDFVEGTEIRPSSEWNTTRSDINAFYSAKFRSVPLPQSRPESYVTTPKFVVAGQQVDAEGLVLNAGTSTVSVSIQLVDQNLEPISEPVTHQVAAGQVQESRTSEGAEPSLKTGSVVYARVTMRSADGMTLQRVYSAPILVYAADEQPIEPMRRTYYSIPARNALPWTPSLTVSGRSDGVVISTITSSGPAHILELLQNTRLAGLHFGTDRAVFQGPMAPRTIVGGQRVAAMPRGFYVARIIDGSGRVGYSAARYVN